MLKVWRLCLCLQDTYPQSSIHASGKYMWQKDALQIWGAVEMVVEWIHHAKTPTSHPKRLFPLLLSTWFLTPLSSPKVTMVQWVVLGPFLLATVDSRFSPKECQGECLSLSWTAAGGTEPALGWPGNLARFTNRPVPQGRALQLHFTRTESIELISALVKLPI